MPGIVLGAKESTVSNAQPLPSSSWWSSEQWFSISAAHNNSLGDFLKDPSPVTPPQANEIKTYDRRTLAFVLFHLSGCFWILRILTWYELRSTGLECVTPFFLPWAQCLLEHFIVIIGDPGTIKRNSSLSFCLCQNQVIICSFSEAWVGTLELESWV